jgi:hypothetical protein
MRASLTALLARFESDATAPARVALEAVSHSGWISRLIESYGHEVIVANPRERLYRHDPAAGGNHYRLVLEMNDDTAATLERLGVRRAQEIAQRNLRQ